MKEKYALGTIELGTEVYVSDPCYRVGTWCQALVKGMKPGKYHGFMYKQNFGTAPWQGRRVTDLWIAHESKVDLFPKAILDSDITIGVDSGAAGIYDKEYFEKYHTLEEGKYIDDYSETSEWYDRQFDLRYYYDKDGNEINPYRDKEVEKKDGIALDNKCVISFSGYGDGSYRLYSYKNKRGEIIGLRIKFI